MAMRPVPSTFPVTQNFRQNLTQYNYGAAHGAIDYATPVGTPIVAPEDGVISYADYAYNLPGGPNEWVSRKYQIKPPFGVFMGPTAGGGILTFLENSVGSTWIFAHLSTNDIAPKGKRVRKGDIIGYTGNTGSSTGPHLHLALIPAGANWSNGFFGGIDPAPYLNETYKPNTTVVDTKTTSERVLNGIDVSAYQPANIVSLVKSDFVIVKTTEGVGWESNVWRKQLADARRLGKKVGVYHFARPTRFGSDEEVDYFYNKVKDQDTADLIWFLDWEEESVYHYTQWARDFMKRLDQKTGKQTGLYANTQALKGGVWTAADMTRPLWRAYPVLENTGYATSFTLPAAPAGWKKLVMDQYSFFGKLPGYTGTNQYLDLNVYYGGLPQWGAIGSAKVTPQTSTISDLETYIMATAEQKLEKVVRKALDIHSEYPRKYLGGIEGSTSYDKEMRWTRKNVTELKERQDKIDKKLDRLLAILDPEPQGSTTVEEKK